MFTPVFLYSTVLKSSYSGIDVCMYKIKINSHLSASSSLFCFVYTYIYVLYFSKPDRQMSCQRLAHNNYDPHAQDMSAKTHSVFPIITARLADDMKKMMMTCCYHQSWKRCTSNVPKLKSAP